MLSRRLGRLAVALLAVVTTLPGAAQSPPVPAFEVASVKRNTSGTPVGLNRTDGSRVLLVNIPLRQIILIAYRIQPFELVGGDAWVDTERFDVTATMPAGVPPAQMGAMLQTLLAERFMLRVRRETRELPVYHLVKARSDGRVGAGLRPAAADCDENGRDRAPTPAAAPVLPAGFSSGVVTGCRLMRTPGWIMAAGQPVSGLATALTQQTGTRVVDRTGIAGNFDFSVSYLPDRALSEPLPREFPGIDANAPALFTALQEQLALKLESQRGSAEVLVIERIDRPSEN